MSSICTSIRKLCKLNWFKLFTSQLSYSRITNYIDFIAKFIRALFPKFFQVCKPNRLKYCVGVKLKAKVRQEGNSNIHKIWDGKHFSLCTMKLKFWLISVLVYELIDLCLRVCFLHTAFLMNYRVTAFVDLSYRQVLDLSLHCLLNLSYHFENTLF